jgi:hypothetical protein
MNQIIEREIEQRFNGVNRPARRGLPGRHGFANFRGLDNGIHRLSFMDYGIDCCRAHEGIVAADTGARESSDAAKNFMHHPE